MICIENSPKSLDINTSAPPNLTFLYENTMRTPMLSKQMTTDEEESKIISMEK